MSLKKRIRIWLGLDARHEDVLSTLHYLQDYIQKAERKSETRDDILDERIDDLVARLTALTAQQATLESHINDLLVKKGMSNLDSKDIKNLQSTVSRLEDMIDNNTDSIEDIRELLAGDNTISENMAKAMAGALATFEQRLEKLERQKAQADDLQRRMEDLD